MEKQCLAGIASALAKSGDMKQARELLGKIDDSQSTNGAMQGLAESQAEAGDFQAALQWARGRATPEARANAFLGLAWCNCEAPMTRCHHKVRIRSATRGKILDEVDE